MVLVVMVGLPFMQYIPLPLVPVIVNPDIDAWWVASPSKVTVFVFPSPEAVIVVELLPAPTKAIPLLI